MRYNSFPVVAEVVDHWITDPRDLGSNPTVRESFLLLLAISQFQVLVTRYPNYEGSFFNGKGFMDKKDAYPHHLIYSLVATCKKSSCRTNVTAPQNPSKVRIF